MLISLNWINELIDIEKINLDELIEKLTLGGFEVEDKFEVVVAQEKETVLEISATANRADSIFTKGIAKEIGALINKSQSKNKYEINHSDNQKILQKSFLSNQILDKYNCSTFITITAENIENISSPKWLQKKLISSEIEPVNNLLDFQNYILLETGYPFEFYDFDKINQKLSSSEFPVTLTTANNDLINNSSYKLSNDTLILKSNDLFLGIAGIIPNDEFVYKEKSKSILIEGSIFNSKKIRQASRNTGLRTDRSARYEKGLNNYNFNETVCRLLNLLRINNPNIKYKINCLAQIPDKDTQKISLTYKNILEILGPTQDLQTKEPTEITVEQITSYLERLDFTYQFQPKDLTWMVIIPNSRVEDLTREIDLIEEIGRLHGFNRFISSLPNVKTIGIEDFSYQIRKKLITCFLSEGLNELMQYSLVKENVNTENSLKLINPLISDCAALRTSLLPNLLGTIEENLKQGNRNIEGFEFGHIFLQDSTGNYCEKEYVGGNFGGVATKRNWSENSMSLSWFEAKGKLEDIFKKLNIGLNWEKINHYSSEDILHPYRAAEFRLLNGNSLGVFGQIHPIIAKKLNISPYIYLFEFNFEVLKNELKNNLLPLYKEYLSYPKITKDLSFIVNKNVPFKKIQDSILKTGTNVLVQSDLLDEYKGESIPLDCISLCIQLTFQSSEKTLRTEEVETIIEKIQTMLTEEYSIIQRV